MERYEVETTDLKGVHVLQWDNQPGQVNPRRITALTIIGNKVKNSQGQEVGEIEEIAFDITRGTITYLVMSSGGLFGIGDKFFAVPMDAFTFDPEEKFFLLNVDKKNLKKHRGFDKNDWPMLPEWPPNGQHAESRKPREEIAKPVSSGSKSTPSDMTEPAARRDINPPVYAAPKSGFGCRPEGVSEKRDSRTSIKARR